MMIGLRSISFWFINWFGTLIQTDCHAGGYVKTSPALSFQRIVKTYHVTVKSTMHRLKCRLERSNRSSSFNMPAWLCIGPFFLSLLLSLISSYLSPLSSLFSCLFVWFDFFFLVGFCFLINAGVSSNTVGNTHLQNRAIRTGSFLN